MNDHIFLAINHGFIAEQILFARKSIFLSIPGITKSISDALIESSKNLEGWDKINVVIDPSPKVYYLGYAEHEAFERLEKSGCNMKCENNLRIGLLIVDGQVFVFSPISLNLESNEEGAESINGLALESKASQSIKEAVSPSAADIKPEIGERVISEIEIKRVENTIKGNPPQKPDLTRKISILTSQFQFVELTFKGSQLKNSKISLDARALGIKDDDLTKRISGQYKLFERLPDKYEKGMYEIKVKYKELRNKFTRTIGNYGTIIWISQSKDFEEAVKELQKKIDFFNMTIVPEIVLEINNSKNRLKQFIIENYKLADNPNKQQGFNQKLTQINKEDLIEKIIEKSCEAYSQKELEKNLELNYKYYNISAQMASDKGFNEKLEKIINVKLDDLVKFENAFGVNEG